MERHLIPRTAPPEEALRAALARLSEGQRVAIATVLRRKGSAPSTPGQKLALLGDREAVGTVGGGALEHRVLASMRDALGAPPSAAGSAEPRVERYELGASMGMCCGGSVEILIEVLEPAFTALVIGAGHIGTALAPLLADLGFRVVVTDAREDAGLFERVRAREGSPERSMVVLEAEHDDPEVAGAAGPPGRAAALVITHDHQLDQAAIEWALRAGFAFVGGVGSRAKAARTRTRLGAKGFAAQDIERVRMPLGLGIGARLPVEIAVSIAGELVEWRAARRVEGARKLAVVQEAGVQEAGVQEAGVQEAGVRGAGVRGAGVRGAGR